MPQERLLGHLNPLAPHSYKPDEVIGGEFILDIETRLLFYNKFPTPIDYLIAGMQAEDLFEVKVEMDHGQP